MMLRHPLRAAAVVAIALACAACGIKGPLYLPPKTPANADTPAPAAPAAAPEVAPGPSSPPLPPTVTPPVEKKS